MHDPAEAIDHLALMLYNSPGGQAIAVNGTVYSAVAASTRVFHQTGSVVLQDGLGVTNRQPTGHYTYDKRVLLVAGKVILNEIASREEFVGRFRPTLHRGGSQDRTIFMNSVPDLAMALRGRWIAKERHAAHVLGA
jgi:hypothetical protein